MAQRQVIAHQKQTPVHSLDPKGNKIKLGHVQTVRYEGEDVYKNSFLPMIDTEPKQLKPTSKPWEVLDHARILSPLFEEGWEAKTIKLSNQGRKMWGLFSNPNGAMMKDIFDWDSGFYPAGTTMRDGGLTQGIVVTSEIAPNRSGRYRAGFYRVVCTNGLISQALGLADVRVNAGNIGDISLAEELFGVDVYSDENIKGPVVGHKKGVTTFAKFLRDYYNEPETVENAPAFVKKLTSSFGNIPTWMGFNAVEQFNAMAKEATEKPRTLDIVNAWTNSINLQQEGDEEMERSTSRGLRKLDALVDSTSHLVGIYSM